MNTLSVSDLLTKLEEKYSQTGQSLTANLEGLLYLDYLKYWDYVQVETLLTLQKPKTNFPDEMIFIVYHQITELYFKLILWELEQIANETLPPAIFLEKIQRLNRYTQALVNSFDIMSVGMQPEQFKKFRMALLPASGFQSAQFRLIEIASTNFINLTTADFRTKTDTNNITTAEIYEHIYWKRGATETETGKKTITLQHFEEKYSETFLQWAYQYRDKNLYQKYLQIPTDCDEIEDIRKALREFDYLFNIEWALSHLKSAVRYLREQGKPIDATGGTNWTKYLPPNFQRIIFFPSLWSQEEKDEWGRKKVEDMLRM